MAFEQAVQLAQAGKHKEADAAFAKIAAGGTAGYRVLARLREAAELAQTDHKAAVAAYDALAADQKVGQVVQDLAAVRAGLLLVDSTPYSELQKRLEPLTASGRPFRHTARELLALSAWKVGRPQRCAEVDRHDHDRPGNAGWHSQPRADFERPHCGQWQQGLSAMRTRQKLSVFRLGMMLACASLLAACTKGGQFDPTTLLDNDMFDNKKPLAGQREPVFPGGVPGVSNGIPAGPVQGLSAAAG